MQSVQQNNTRLNAHNKSTTISVSLNDEKKYYSYFSNE